MIIYPNIIISLIFILVTISLASTDTTTQPTEQNDDYFHDEGLTPEQIKKIEQDKLRSELEKKLLNDKLKSTEKPPQFFEKNIEQNDKNKNIDWDKYYMEKMMTEYMKKYQQEQLEKRRLKAKSDLNHPMLSVITLVIFFGLGTFIGLIIIVVRSKQFQKSTYKTDKGNTLPKKPIYDQVKQTENVV